MFNELLGLPAHPLLVHAAVIFGPLLVLSVVVYSLVPPARRFLGWTVVALAVAAPAALWFAKLSGEELLKTLIAKNYPQEIISQVGTHAKFGDVAAWTGTALGVLSLFLVLICTAAGKKPATPASRSLTYGIVVISLLVAGATGYYVFKTGDTGAHIVWGSI
ncbi:hypothetical protein Cs7R123_77360 [Catellatospora sp. TT07R-123]|uniref:hypothetical protein n=1 Tax=Catellatospora sp. TT07R-123 TaxID=2733863 RepID=UPI001B1F7C97|nr:hypothetical protein [Catellatospora sp. TT07R-123]GHJ50394.1 hypothetical protein Cs7R123_77360 [Catellatospora sp. TT07R-123]